MLAQVQLTPSRGAGRVLRSTSPCSTRNEQKVLAAIPCASFLLPASPHPMNSNPGTRALEEGERPGVIAALEPDSSNREEEESGNVPIHRSEC